MLKAQKHPYFLIWCGALVFTSIAAAQTECWESVVPAGALESQPSPVFCSIDGQGPGTEQTRPNRSRDLFNHGLSFAGFEGTSYRVFDAAGDSLFDSIHWRHADHWMVDIAPVAPDSPFGPATGGSLLSPPSSYSFIDGTLAIEATFAAGHQDYANLAAWGEIVVTTAPQPTEFRSGGTYGYDFFPGHFTLGCRLQADRITVCSLMDNTERGTLEGGRVWEMSFFQMVGDVSRGGFPGNYDPPAFRVCNGNSDPDTECRDHFRLELTETSVTLFVNGKPYFQQTGVPSLPAELLNGELYVYFASMIGISDYEVIRFHWDGLAVNARSPLPDGF